MSQSKGTDDSFSPRSGGSDVNSQGSSTPRGSFRNSREDLLSDSYGSYGSNPDLRYNINDELDDWRHGATRQGSHTSFREGRLFLDVLDELEYQIRKAEDDSTSLIHDFNVLRNQHQSQTRRINDLIRGFEEAKYVMELLRGGRYRKRSVFRGGDDDNRNFRRRSNESLSSRVSSERFGRRSSIDRLEQRGSSERIERRGSFDRVERRGSSDDMESRNSLDRRDSFDRISGKREEDRGYHKSGPTQRSPERLLKSKSSTRTIASSVLTESRC